MAVPAESPAFCGGLIEVELELAVWDDGLQESPAFCGGLIEVILSVAVEGTTNDGIPRVLRGPH